MKAVFGLVLVMALVLGLHAGAFGANLLVNPSFEYHAAEDGVAPGWAQYNLGGDAAGWLKPWGDDFGEWLAVVGGWPGEMPGAAMWAQSVPCTPGQQITFRMHSRGVDGFNGEALLRFEFYYPNTEGGEMALQVVDSATPLTGEYPWTLMELTATVPPDASRVRAIALAENVSGGCVFFDNAYLTTSGTPSRVTAGQARNLADGSLVWLEWPVVTLDNGSDYFQTDCYVTDYARSGSIRLRSGNPMYSNGFNIGVLPGIMMYVMGTVGTYDDEKIIQAIDLIPVNWDGPWPRPVSMVTRSIPMDPDKNGLLITVAGKVTSVASDFSYFHVDDGSGVAGEIPNTGIKVKYTAPGGEPGYPAVGDMVVVTGVCRVEDRGFANQHYSLTPRFPSDYRLVAMGDLVIGRNILYNPGFENEWVAWWGGSNKDNNGVQIEGWAARTGAFGGAFYGWDGNPEAPLYTWLGQTVDAVEGATYEFSAWALKEENFVGDLRLKLEWRDSEGLPVGEDVWSDVLSAGVDWQEFSIQGVCPVGAATLNVVFAGDDITAGAAAKIDDTVLKAVQLP